MEIIVFQRQYSNSDALQDFLNRYYQKSMNHLASDLLVKGVHPEDIKQAVKKAILATENSGFDAKKHFQPIISVTNGTSFLDCRLSKLGYSLVLLNVEPKSEYIAKLQVEIATQVLNVSLK